MTRQEALARAKSIVDEHQGLDEEIGPYIEGLFLDDHIAAALLSAHSEGWRAAIEAAKAPCNVFADCPAKGASEFVSGQATAAQQIRAAISALKEPTE